MPATVTAVPGTSIVELDANGTIGFPALAAGATCTLSVDVVATGGGELDNVSDQLLADFEPAGSASATLTVLVPELSISKSFIDDPVVAGAEATLEFTIENLNRSEAATGVTFTDDVSSMADGFVLASPASDPCGAGSTLTGTTTLTLSGGTIDAEAKCTFTVTLSNAGLGTDGIYPNTTSAVSGLVGGLSTGGDAASDDLIVSTFPTFTKEFIDATTGDPDPVVNPGDPVIMRFTIQNNSTTALSAITFSDELTDSSGTPGAAPGMGFPSDSFTYTTLPATACDGSIGFVSFETDRDGFELTGGDLAASASCTFDVTMTVPAVAPGIYTNTTSSLTALLGATTVTSPPASDDLTVASAVELSKAFDGPVVPGGTATLAFTLSHAPSGRFSFRKKIICRLTSSPCIARTKGRSAVAKSVV